MVVVVEGCHVVEEWGLWVVPVLILEGACTYS